MAVFTIMEPGDRRAGTRGRAEGEPPAFPRPGADEQSRGWTSGRSARAWLCSPLRPQFPSDSERARLRPMGRRRWTVGRVQPMSRRCGRGGPAPHTSHALRPRGPGRRPPCPGPGSPNWSVTESDGGSRPATLTVAEGGRASRLRGVHRGERSVQGVRSKRGRAAQGNPRQGGEPRRGHPPK